MSVIVIDQGELTFTETVAGEVRLSRRLVVKTVAAGQAGVAEIVADTTLPQPGSASSNIAPYGKLICRDRKITYFKTLEKDTAYLFNVDLEYDNTPNTATQSTRKPTAETPPWDLPAEFSYSTVAYDTVLFRDKTGARIENSAGDNFEPQPSAQVYRLNVSVRKNYEDFELVTLKNTINTINDGAITCDGVEYADGQCLMRNITIDKAYWGVTGEEENPVAYYAVAFEFEVIINAGTVNGGTSADTYKLYVLDSGLRIKDGAGKKWITGTDDNPPSSPELLNGSGAKLAGGGTPVYKPFDVYEKASWAGFNFE